MLKTADLRGMTIEELREKATALKKELMQYRFQAKTGKLERQSLLRQTKTDIARIFTIMREKELEEVKK
jgi:large subunit ribosomal protein L29